MKKRLAMLADPVAKLSAASVQLKRPGRAWQGELNASRVLFLADHLGYSDGVVHGGTTYFLQVLPALLESGMHVSACFLREPHPAAAQLAASGIEATFLAAARFSPFVIGPIARMVREDGYGVVHAAGFKACLAARLVARQLPVRAIMHVHDMSMPPPHIRLLNRLTSQPSDWGVCVSEAAREIAVRGYCLRREQVQVVYTGIDTAQFCNVTPAIGLEVRRELGVPQGAPTLVMVGRFYPVKGHMSMMQIFRTILARVPECMLLLVGDGPERKRCEALSRKLGLSSNVRFLGTRSDVARLLAAADVVVVPSRSEGLCRVAIEANLSGRPVVAYATGGLVDVINNPDCGRLVRPGDLRDFAEAVVSLLQDEASSSPAAALIRARLARDRFGIQTHIRSLRDCYLAACR